MRNDSMIFRHTNVLTLDPRADRCGVDPLVDLTLILSHVYTRRVLPPYLAHCLLAFDRPT